MTKGCSGYKETTQPLAEGPWPHTPEAPPTGSPQNTCRPTIKHPVEGRSSVPQPGRGASKLPQCLQLDEVIRLEHVPARLPVPPRNPGVLHRCSAKMTVREPFPDPKVRGGGPFLHQVKLQHISSLRAAPEQSRVQPLSRSWLPEARLSLEGSPNISPVPVHLLHWFNLYEIISHESPSSILTQ